MKWVLIMLLQNNLTQIHEFETEAQCEAFGQELAERVRGDRYRSGRTLAFYCIGAES